MGILRPNVRNFEGLDLDPVHRMGLSVRIVLRWAFAGAPMAFMLVMTMSALVLLILQEGPFIIRAISSALFVLGLMLSIEAARAFRLAELGPEPVTLKPVGAGGD